MITVYQYPACSTCKKALKFLDNANVRYEAIDIVSSPPSKSRLLEVIAATGGNIKRLFNTSGVLYREMKVAEKLPALSSDDAATLLSSHGKLIKRPLVVGASTPLIGFDEKEWRRVLG
jgi:arsenate reductase